MRPIDKIIPGHYRRFDGVEVQVICVARHTEGDYSLVIWSAMTQPADWQASPEGVFRETITSGGRQLPRFQRIEEAVVVIPEQDNQVRT